MVTAKEHYGTKEESQWGNLVRSMKLLQCLLQGRAHVYHTRHILTTYTVCCVREIHVDKSVLGRVHNCIQYSPLYLSLNICPLHV